MHFTLLDTQQRDHDGFSCGEPSLDAYLRERAEQHHRDGIATPYVLVGHALTLYLPLGDG